MASLMKPAVPDRDNNTNNIKPDRLTASSLLTSLGLVDKTRRNCYDIFPTIHTTRCPNMGHVLRRRRVYRSLAGDGSSVRDTVNEEFPEVSVYATSEPPECRHLSHL